FIEAGGLANYVRSSAISTALAEQFPWVPAPPETVGIVRSAGGPGVSLRWVMLGWFAIGAGAVSLCWWLRADYLPVLCIGWAAVLVLLIVARRVIGLADL